MDKNNSTSDLISFAAMFAFVIIAIKVFSDLLDKENSFTSEKGRKILANEKERDKVFEAMKNGESSVETEYGKLHIQ